jgi:hypothetical protein
MAAKDEQQHQHVAPIAFKIHNFWPHDPDTWFRQLESKFRICNISTSSTKFDHLLTALPTEVCSNITDILKDIDEAAADAYEQLKALLVSRYTRAGWARAFELLKYPKIGDMKPTELMRQMKALLPTDDRPGTTFMAMFLLRLPSDMRDHLIAKDFKDCTMIAEYSDLLYSSRAAAPSPPLTQNTRRPSTSSPAAAAGSSRPTIGSESAIPRVARGASAGRPPARTRRAATFATSTLHTATRRGSANPGACGQREMD